MDDRWAAKLEELRVGAVSHGVEWLHSALSELFRDELRPLAAAGGVETRPDNKWCFQSLALMRTCCSLASVSSCEPRQFFPAMSLCWCGQKMRKPRLIVETGTGDDKVIMLQYEKVVAVEAPFPKHFRVEAFCRLQQAIRFNMCDGNVHLVIGKVTAEDDGSDMVTERVFKLQSEEQVKAVMAERAGIAAVQMISSKKRHAVDLVEKTPLKVKSAKW